MRETERSGEILGLGPRLKWSEINPAEEAL